MIIALSILAQYGILLAAEEWYNPKHHLLSILFPALLSLDLWAFCLTLTGVVDLGNPMLYFGLAALIEIIWAAGFAEA